MAKFEEKDGDAQKSINDLLKNLDNAVQDAKEQ